MLAPLLATPARRTSAVVIRSAEAAAAWGGNSDVQRLLTGEKWLDGSYGGYGYVVLARAALAVSPRLPSNDSLAYRHAARAVATIPRNAPNGARGERETLLARAAERIQMRDSASVHYLRAAELMPELRDWFKLRAAHVTSDADARARHYDALQLQAAIERQQWVEAAAREEQRDYAVAATLYDKLGATVDVFRMRWLLVSDSTARDSVRGALLAFLPGASGANARGALALLDANVKSFSAAEQLVIARAAVAGSRDSRAVSAFAAVFGASTSTPMSTRAGTATGTATGTPTGTATGTPAGTATGTASERDRFAYAQVLSRLGRDRDAAAQFAQIGRPSPLAGIASYQRARSLLRASGSAAAIPALVKTSKDFSSDTDAASSALYLLGDLSSDNALDTQARTYFRQLSTKYPSSRFAPQARLRAAIMAYVAGEYKTAALEFDSLVTRYPTHAEAPAAKYWSGRAWKKAGNASTAQLRWKAVIDRNEVSYYGILSARALDIPIKVPFDIPPVSASGAASGSTAETSNPTAAPTTQTAATQTTATPTPTSATTSLLRPTDSLPHLADIDSAVFRAQLLQQLGMDDEAQFEDDYLVKIASDSVPRLLATAQAFAERGNPSRSMSFARRALDRGATATPALLRLLYPVAQESVLLAESRRNKLDPSLVAALIRQESNFTPRATSGAGARGLMQVMPAVGRGLARTFGYPEWNDALLYQPDVNVQLGTHHLARALDNYSNPALALAAYNAGESRVKRWITKGGATDPELFVERIPYVETRDYVRIVLRNQAMYRMLYGWPE